MTIDQDCEVSVRLLSQEHPPIYNKSKTWQFFRRVNILACVLFMFIAATGKIMTEREVTYRDVLLPSDTTTTENESMPLIANSTITIVPKQSAVQADNGNVFVQSFEKALSENVHPFMAFIIDDGKIWYRQKRLDELIEKRRGHGRLKSFAHMVTKVISSFVKETANTSSAAISTTKEKSREALLLTGKVTEGGGMPVLLSYGDTNGCGSTGKEASANHFPRLTWSIPAHREDCMAISVPGYKSWSDHRRKRSSSDWDEMFRKQKALYPWSSKIAKALWRGSTTGQTRTQDELDFETLPRAQLVQHSIDHPDIIDAAFTFLTDRFVDSNKNATLANLTHTGSEITMNDFMTYRAIIDIDGNNWSSRFGELLCTNSVVIKIEPGFIEYFYDDISPWIHYVPAYGNMTNLVDIVKYVLDKENDRQMKEIVEAANTWCKNHLTGPQMTSDMRDILLSYVNALEVQDGEWRKKWVDNGIASGRDVDDMIEYTGFVPLAELTPSKTGGSSNLKDFFFKLNEKESKDRIKPDYDKIIQLDDDCI